VEFADGTWVRYRYDAFGRLAYREENTRQNSNQQKSEITHYLYDGLEVLMEVGGGPGQGLSPLAEYYRAGGSLVARKIIGYHGRKEQGHEEFVRTRGGPVVLPHRPAGERGGADRPEKRIPMFDEYVIPPGQLPAGRQARSSSCSLSPSASASATVGAEVWMNTPRRPK
jgi:YD repeat-containing protein